MERRDIIKYIAALIITAGIFLTAFAVSSMINNNRIADIRAIQDKISIDILSSDTQFALLRDSSCRQLSDSILSQELNGLAGKLDFMEKQLGVTNSQVVALKQDYSLLQIKDYLLMRQLTERCNIKPISVIYFYSNKAECTDCSKQAYVLSYLRDQYPDLRVYAFDYDLNLSAIDTLIKLNKVEPRFPALVLPEGKVLYGFTPIEQIENLVPELASLASTTATTTATSTVKQPKK